MNDQVTREETSAILRLAESTLSLSGDFVELGCYRGDTSVLLGQLLAKSYHNSSSKIASSTPASSLNNLPAPAPKNLWIYDSFAGLPEKTPEDSSGAGANFQAGALLVTKREVIDKLRKHGLKTSSHADSSSSTVIVKKAWFDQLTTDDLPTQIAFAFCDGDLYRSIKTSLALVAPRLARQGIIIVHDYNNPELPGSARAVDQFLRTHPEYRLQVLHTLAILTQKS